MGMGGEEARDQEREEEREGGKKKRLTKVEMGGSENPFVEKNDAGTQDDPEAEGQNPVSASSSLSSPSSSSPSSLLFPHEPHDAMCPAEDWIVWCPYAMYSAGCMPLALLLLLPVDAVAGVGRTLAEAPLGPVLLPSSSLRSFSSYCDDAIARNLRSRSSGGRAVFGVSAD